MEGTFTLKNVRNILWDARIKWFDLGIELDLPEDKLRVIQKDNPSDVEKCFTEMISTWLKETPEKSWSAIIKALKAPAVNLAHLGNKVEQEQANHYKPQQDQAMASTKDCSTQTKSNESTVETTGTTNVCASHSVTDNKNLKFPLLENYVLDDTKRKELTARLNVESQDLMLKFFYLMNKIFDSFDKQKITAHKLRRYLNALKAFEDPLHSETSLHAHKDMLEKSNSIEDIKDVIEKYSSFCDFRLVEYLIGLSGTEEDKQELEKYVMEFENYALRRVYECPSEVGATCMPSDSKLCVKLDSVYDDYSFIQLKRFEGKLASILKVSTETLRFEKIEMGCIQLTFLIPNFVKEFTFPLSHDQEIKLFQQQVKYLTCGNYTFVSSAISADNISDSSSDNDDSSSDSGEEAANPLLANEKIEIDSGRGTSIGAEVGDNTTTFSEATNETNLEESDIDYHSTSESCLTVNTELLVKSAYTGDLTLVKLVTRGRQKLQNASGNTILHFAAGGGQVLVAKYLIEEEEYNASIEGSIKQTPLHTAAQYGHLDVASYLLLQQKVEPCQVDRYNRNALHYACIGGNPDIVKLLLKEMKEYSEDYSHLVEKTLTGQTPLHIAARYGHLKIVEFLILVLVNGYTLEQLTRGFGEIKIDVDEADDDRYIEEHNACNALILDRNMNSPLHFAASNGHFAVVKVLVNQRVCDPQRRNNKHLTPFHLAASNGHLNIVQFFTINQALCDPNTPGFRRRTALHLASKAGHFDVVKYLVLEKHCNYWAMDEDGALAAQLAKQGGHKIIEEFLVAKSLCLIALMGNLNHLKRFLTTTDIKPEVFDETDHTPLFYAVQKGHLSIVKYLMESHNCSRISVKSIPLLHFASAQGHLPIIRYLMFERHHNAFSKASHDVLKDILPIHMAICNGKLDVVKFFISYSKRFLKIDSNKKSLAHWAAEGGYLNLIKYLVEDETLDPECRDMNNCTPLHIAASEGHLEIVKYLVMEKICDQNCKSDGGLTPLHCAAQEGHLHVVRHLVEEYGCDPHEPDDHKQIPLHLASLKGHLDIVKYLTLERHCNYCRKSESNHTSLHHAVSNGHLEIVKFFIEELKCDPNVKGYEGRPPIHDAAAFGFLEIVMYLIEKQHCDPASPDKEGFTTLHQAACEGHLDILKYLISKQKCDPFCKDVNGITLLTSATQVGQYEIVKYLVEDIKLNPLQKRETSKKNNHNQSQNDFSKTPLHFAISDGHTDIVKCLLEKSTSREINTIRFVRDEPRTNVSVVELSTCLGHLDIVKFLTLDKKCKVGSSVVYAALTGNMDIIRFLTSELGCDPDKAELVDNLFKRTPLQMACQEGFLEIVKYLIEKKNCSPTAYGDTYDKIKPLHLAALHGHADIVKYLVCERHVDPMCKTSNGLTPVDLARESGYAELTKFLTVYITLHYLTLPHC